MEESSFRLICKYDKIESKYIVKWIFNLLEETKKLKILINNKHMQTKLEIDINNYQEISNKIKVGERNGLGKEYIKNSDTLIYAGNYLNRIKNGGGTEYYLNGNKKFEGIYFKGKKLSGKGYDKKYNLLLEINNGKGVEYYANGKYQFIGEYLNGKRWNGKCYDYNGNEIFKIKSGSGKIKEYYYNGNLKFEGEYFI